MNAPRVLVSGLVLDQPMGGVQRHNRELLPRAARLLAERGGGLCVLAGARGLAFELPGPIDVLPSRLPSRPAWVRAPFERAGLARVLAEAAGRGLPFGVVHTAHLPLPRELELPMTLTVHDLKDLHRPSTSLPRHLVAGAVVTRALRRAAHVLAVSAALRDELVALDEVAPERISVLPNAADHLDPLPRNVGPDAPMVHVGHIEQRKNLALILRAMAHDASLPRLVLAGAPRGSEDVRLRDLACDLGLSARVEFVGLLDDDGLRTLLAQAACAVFPSRREGFCIPALEAQAAGVPLAVSTSAALREVTGEQTPSFAPDDAQACARAIRAALDSPRSALDAAAVRATRYRWDESAARLVAVWCALGRP